MRLRITRFYPLLDRGQILAHVDANRWDELGPYGPVRVVLDGESVPLRYSGRMRVRGSGHEPVIVLEALPGSEVTLSALLARLGEPDDTGFLIPSGASIVPAAGVERLR